MSNIIRSVGSKMWGGKTVSYRTTELVGISVPMIVEQVCITLMGIVSTMLVKSLGEHVVSGVGMVDAISNLVIALFAALTTGGTIVVAQCFGRGEKERAKNSAAQAIILSFAFSLVMLVFLGVFKESIILFLYSDAKLNVRTAANSFMHIINFSYPILAYIQTVFGILRGSGDTSSPMVVSILMNVINLALGFALIKGISIGPFVLPSFGVEGAAIALLAARGIGALVCSYLLFHKNKKIRIDRFKYFKPDWKLMKSVLAFGVPTSVESGMFQLGRLLTMTYIVKMGTEAIAANTVGGSIFGFINVPGNAFATGVMILVGHRIGRGEREDVKSTTTFAMLLATVMLSVLCLIVFIFSGPIISMYDLSEGAQQGLYNIFISGFIATPLFWAFSFVTPASLRATGDVKYTMVVSIISMWTLRIILGYIYGIVFKWGVVGVWLGMYTDWIVRGILFNIRLFNGKWQNKEIK